MSEKKKMFGRVEVPWMYHIKKKRVMSKVLLGGLWEASKGGFQGGGN